MGMTPQPQTENTVMGGGRAWFDPFDANGKRTGRYFMGKTPQFNLAVNSESVDVDDPDAAVATVDFTLTTKVTRSGSLECRDCSDKNTAAFFMGEVGSVVQDGTPVVDEPLNEGNGVLQGRYYQIGESVFPTGLRNLSSVTITDDGGTPTTFTVDVDYTLYAEQGQIYVIPGGGIADGTKLLGDATPDSSTREQVVTNEDGAWVGELWYAENLARGVESVWRIPYVELSANGDWAMKSREAPRVMTFDVKVQTHPDGNLAQIYRDGKPVA